MYSRPPVFTWNEELHFGPPSEPISIQRFLDDALGLRARGLSPWGESCPMDNESTTSGANAGWKKKWQELPEELRTSTEEECDLGDLSLSLIGTLSSQKHLHLLQTAHSEALNQCGVIQNHQKKVKAKSKQASHQDPDLDEFKKTIESTPLKMWKLKPSAKPFVRSGHISDQNALDTSRPRGAHTINEDTPFSREVIITLTTYIRNTWYPFAFSRESQHALLSRNTLADIWSCVPCALKGDGEFPREVIEYDEDPSNSGQRTGSRTGRVVGYEKRDGRVDPDDIVIAVEGVAYCNRRGPLDYSDKLLSHVETFKSMRMTPDVPPPLPPGPYERPANTVPLTKGPALDSVRLSSLTLRVNEPYWIFHRGSCEHWFVIDEIRLQNPRDPPSGYPIDLQLTPSSRPLCRICSKVPATLSILNDVRLGESPSLVCHSCWDLFGGLPQVKQGDDIRDAVLVVPIIFKK